VQRHERDAAPLVRVRKLPREPVGHRRHVGVRGVERDAGHQASDGSKHVLASSRRWSALDRQQPPDAGPAEQLEVSGNHAQNRVRDAIEADVAARDLRVRAEARPPEALAQDDGVRTPGVVLRKERAPDNRTDTEDVEEAGGHPLSGHVLGEAVRAGHHHAAHARDVGGDQLERAIPPVPVQKVPRRYRAPCRCGAPFGHHHEALGFPERKRAQERGVDQGEDGAVGADAERDGEHNHCSEAGLAPQHSDGVAQVLPELGRGPPAWHAGRGRGLDVCLAQGSHVAGQRVAVEQFVHRKTPRVGFAASAFSELVVSLVEMLRQLLDDLCLAGRTEPQRSQPWPQVLGPATPRLGSGRP